MGISIEIKDGKAYITSPYNADFVQRIKLMGGRWEKETKRWSIKEEMIDAARTVMMEVYGETDCMPAGETVTLEVRVIDCIAVFHNAIMIAGKTIATATGRDSGARVGDDVAFLVGEPESGGSVKNWKTIIQAGAEFLIYNVPLAKAEEAIANQPEQYVITIRKKQVNREALIAEEKKLLERLAEIRALLKEGEETT